LWTLSGEKFSAALKQQPVSNWYWSSRASSHPEVLARNLTVEVSLNQAAAKLLVMDASIVPKVDAHI
jgi:hypothetical protein